MVIIKDDDYYKDNPFYVDTGKPPREIECPECCGEGIDLRTDENGVEYYTTLDGKCPRCKGYGLVENTEKKGTTYVRIGGI